MTHQALPTEDSPAGEYARQLGRAIGPAIQAPDDSNNAADLLTLGESLDASRQTGATSIDQAFVDTASDLLSEQERCYGLPIRTDLPDDVRQRRLVAKVRARFAGTVNDITAAIRALDPTATIRENTAATVLAVPEFIFQFAIVISPGAWSTPTIHDQVEAIARQMKPAHTGFAVVTRVGFRCDDPASRVDRDALGS